MTTKAYDIPRVVVLGGGTGLAAPLAGLKQCLHSVSRDKPYRAARGITAVVAVSDDGGSSGRIRRATPMIAPGDIRRCLLALSDADASLKSIFEYRFPLHAELQGHSLGNLIIAAMVDMHQDPVRALQAISRMLRLSGAVLPCTKDHVVLIGHFEGGSSTAGESNIRAAGKIIRRISIEPAGAAATPEAVEAIRAADLIVLGPGSLYTSLIPILCLNDIQQALHDTSAQLTLVCNLMGEPGETLGYSASDFVAAIADHCGGLRPDLVLANSHPPNSPRVAPYASQGAHPVPIDVENVQRLGCSIILENLLSDSEKVRHDPVRLAKCILRTWSGRRKKRSIEASRRLVHR